MNLHYIYVIWANLDIYDLSHIPDILWMISFWVL